MIDTSPKTPHYDGGSTYGYVSVQFFISPGAQQTTTTNPQQLPGWPNPKVDVAGVRQVISKWLTPECASFVKTILEGVATKKNPLVKGTNLLDVFDALVNDPSNKGIIRGAPPDGQRRAGGTVRGGIGKDAAIYLPGYDARGTSNSGAGQ